MSSCFFSSRLKMRISREIGREKRCITALPKEPVPPVIARVLPANIASFPSALPEQVGEHLVPARRDEAGTLGKPFGGQRPVDMEGAVGNDLDRLA